VSRLNRRQCMQHLCALGLAAVSSTLFTACSNPFSRGPEPLKPVRLGYLSYARSVPTTLDFEQAFFDGLREHGYLEGQNLIIERRYGEAQPEHLRLLAAELVALPVDIIFAAGGTITAAAAKETTSTIPMVTATGDLVGTRLVASLARPGGNVTGLASITSQLAGKRLELLKATVPSVAQVAVIWNPASATAAISLAETQTAASALGLGLLSLEVQDASDLLPALDAAREQADAVVVLGDPFTLGQAARIAELAVQRRLPTVFQPREFTDAGGLMSYGPNFAAQYRRAAYYVDRILKGTKPADLPVEQPMTFDFVVNMKTAQALGIAFPNEIMLQVTEVVQ
jgi:putative tryptophan/tyrosine transport system substrate-binding protein